MSMREARSAGMRSSFPRKWEPRASDERWPWTPASAGVTKQHLDLVQSCLGRLALCAAMFVTAPAMAEVPQFGQPIAPAEIEPWDISIGPDGAGLPPGSGTAAQGEVVYAAKCQACHGEKGAGGPNDVLAGGFGSLALGKTPVKTVGSYWPYATTLFDYIRRAMPFPETKSLTNDEVYAVAAYILNLNGIISADQVLDAHSLPAVKMPNRAGFVPFPRYPK